MSRPETGEKNCEATIRPARLQPGAAGARTGIGRPPGRRRAVEVKHLVHVPGSGDCGQRSKGLVLGVPSAEGAGR